MLVGYVGPIMFIYIMEKKWFHSLTLFGDICSFVIKIVGR